MKSPAGAHQWKPKAGAGNGTVPDAHDPSITHAPTMLTTDLALILDPAYAPISKRFYENPDQFNEAFARAWFKLTHRDMGPISRYLGPEVPKEELLWQDPIPTVNYKLSDTDIESLKKMILSSGLTVSQLVRTAWASASTFRGSDMRGGANGGRIRLEPQRSWEANNPKELDKVLKVLEGIQKEFKGRVIDKFIDYPQHATESVRFSPKSKVALLRGDYYNEIEIGDSIHKIENSFKLEIHKRDTSFEMTYKLPCEEKGFLYHN